MKKALLPLLVLLSCQKKVPLQSDTGWFETSEARWFENEKTAYIFFKLNEAPERLSNSFFEYSYTFENKEGGFETIEYKTLDVSTGVHEHEIAKCGWKSLCGSFSWKQDHKLIDLKMRLRYDPSSELSIEEPFFNIQNHELNLDDPLTYSAVPFAVFDAKGEHVQHRILHNFGHPSHDQVASYGLKRRFKVLQAYLNDAMDPDAAAALKSKVNHVFPASHCANALGGGEDDIIVGQGNSWLVKEFSASSGLPGVCIDLDFVDKNDQKLLTTKAYGFKNPNASFSNLRLKSPLKSVIKIPLTILPCEGEFKNSLMDSDFLKYQQDLLGINSDEEYCFDVSEPDEFKSGLRTYLTNTLSAYKAQSNPDKRDYMFLVAFNERLSKEFYHIHQSIAEEIYRLGQSEAENYSPRFVGGFVYGSTGEFQPTAAQRKHLLWCPQELDESLLKDVPIDLLGFTTNCTTSTFADIDILGIKFVVPLGPFPSLDNYVEYTREYGTTGVAQNPSLNLSSVTVDETSRTETGGVLVTYFGNQRLAVNDQESVQVCQNLDHDFMLLDVLLKPPQLEGADQGIDIFTAEPFLKNLDRNEPEEYEFGVTWNLPFWGGVSYKSQTTIDFISVIPFLQARRNFEEVGDSKWRRSTWPIGNYLMHCKAFCEHPFFDEGGIYQTNSWSEGGTTVCASPKVPTWNGGDAL